MSNSQLMTSQMAFCQRNSDKDREKEFWQQWEKYRDHLYHCCLKWMRDNPSHAEEVLSRAMLKAWEKFRDSTYVISNFKAWLIRLTYNLCVDIQREWKRGGYRVESLDAMAERGEVELISWFDTPGKSAMQDELKTIIHNAIADLPPRLREPFTLHFILEKSYQDIAQELGISYDNLCQRIFQAREILQKRLRSYLSEFDDSPFEPSPSLSKKAKFGVEKLPSQTMAVKVQTPSTSNQKDCCDRCPHYYQVTAICLETLPHVWYQSPSPLGWN
ncbi:RNA polymerase sigma factor [Aerosakkonemataceae cyanobacterium BLCC-F154]|uniref:RNA polymerase sigma factor n=1 Tax=Floridaenema fluviatile BLCC-F154 TaxID=3153640 RepID=A0ABV4Y664_9CYAN